MVQVVTWLDPDVKERVQRRAARHGRSLQEEMSRIVRVSLGEEVGDDSGGDRSRVGCDAGADRRVSRPVEGGVREHSSGERVGDGGDAGLIGAENVPLWAESIVAERHLRAVGDTIPERDDDWLDIP